MSGIDETARSLLNAVLAVPAPRSALGESVWLYLRCLTLATVSGHACRARARLAQDLQVTEPDIDRWMEQLARADLVRVMTPPPYLVLKLTAWSSSDSRAAGAAAEGIDAEPSPMKSVPVSSAAAASSKQGEGGVGEGAMLLDDAVAVLGTEHRAELTRILERSHESLVRRALRRVELTPEDQIRKSKLALFRFLLVKLPDEP